MSAYLVEIDFLQTTYVRVEADTEQDAKEKAIDGDGEIGQSFPPVIEKVSVELINSGNE